MRQALLCATLRLMPVVRLDESVVQLGLAETLDQAQRLIRAGRILVNGHAATKPGVPHPAESEITLDAPARFVSRGGDKLEGAFAHFALTVENEVCLDIGASTGGFTDCLLQHGARKVYAVDVGRNLLHPRIASDPRVVAMDALNVRRLKTALFPEPPTFATVDASFISLRLILPVVSKMLPHGARIVTLIKPQFEADPADVKKGGVVRDEHVREKIVAQVRHTGEIEAGLEWKGVCPSPLRGPAGNIEYLAYWIRP